LQLYRSFVIDPTLAPPLLESSPCNCHHRYN